MAGEKFRGYTNSHGETKVADEHGNQWSGYANKYGEVKMTQTRYGNDYYGDIPNIRGAADPMTSLLRYYSSVIPSAFLTKKESMKFHEETNVLFKTAIILCIINLILTFLFNRNIVFIILSIALLAFILSTGVSDAASFRWFGWISLVFVGLCVAVLYVLAIVDPMAKLMPSSGNEAPVILYVFGIITGVFTGFVYIDVMISGAKAAANKRKFINLIKKGGDIKKLARDNDWIINI